MRILTTVAALAFAATSFAQMIDDITLKMMSPKWSTVMVGSQSNFRQAGHHVIRNYNEWQQAWPYVAGANYRYGVAAPQMINWSTEQLIMISLGNLGAQGYGVYVEDIRRVSNYSFNINFVITRPSFQAGISYSSFNFGIGSSPYVAIRVPRSYGISNFNSRYYNPPSYVINYGCG